MRLLASDPFNKRGADELTDADEGVNGVPRAASVTTHLKQNPRQGRNWPDLFFAVVHDIP